MSTDEELTARTIDALTDAQFAQLALLRVTERQEYLGGSFGESLEAWRAGPRSQVLGICFLLGEVPVGMTLFKRSSQEPEWVPDDAACIHGLKIALPWQGRGLGHRAFALAIDCLCREWPDLRRIMLAVDADNTAALAVYRGFGMEDSGAVFHGNHGPEHRMSAALPH